MHEVTICTTIQKCSMQGHDQRSLFILSTTMSTMFNDTYNYVNQQG